MSHENTPSQLTRRQFLVLSVGSAAVATVPLLVGCDLGASPTPTGQPQPGPTPGQAQQGTPTGVAPAGLFVPTKEIRSQNGVLQTSLLVKMQTFDSIPVRIFGSPKESVSNPNPDNDGDWDFTLPGPTYRLNAGDQVKITLHNRLSGSETDNPPGVCQPEFYPPGTPTPDQMPDCFHENNTVNIHYHGLHVSQDFHADNVFINLYPKDQANPPPVDDCHAIGQYDYSFQVPADHPLGTFWYHPHKHGSATIQSANGMAGAWIVEDQLSKDPAFRGQLKDYTMVVQVVRETINRPNGGQGPQPSELRVNGELQTTVGMQVGEVQRWRILNATWSDQTDFNVEFPPNTVEMYLIAMDGYFIPPQRWDKREIAQYFYIAPGNRADFLVKAVGEGTIRLRARPNVSSQSPRRRQPPGAPGPTPTLQPTVAVQPTEFMSVVVSGRMDPPMGLPAKLPPLTNDQRPITDGEIVDKKTLKFTIQSGTGVGNNPKFLIAVNDGPPTEFDPNVVNECVEVDTAEEWTYENYTGVGHPCHIHLNPFFVTDFFDPNDPPNPASPHGQNMKYNDPVGLWQDTLRLRMASPLPARRRSDTASPALPARL
jgi:FtsP/CotA-like multicopper oxidase with cupredoxin domain